MSARATSNRVLAMAAAMLMWAAATAPGQTPPPPPLPTAATLPAATTMSAAAADKPKTVTNLWVESEIRQVMQDISAQTETVILCDPTVQGVVSMSVKDMSLRECLERVCAPGGYSFVQVKDYYIVGRAEPGSPLFGQMAEPTRIKLSFMLPEQVRGLLHASMTPYVTFDKGSGSVIVTAPEPIRHRVLEAIKLIDQPNQQVAIEAVVFELTEEGSKELALDWKFKAGQWSGGMNNLVGTIAYGAGSDMGTYVDLTLRAIVQSRRGQVLANPRVLVLSNTEAEIFVGQEKYFSLLSGQASNPYYTLQSIKSGVTLKVSPYISEDGQITLGLEPEVSDVLTEAPAQGGMGTDRSLAVSSPLPVVTRRHAKTVISIRDGQSVLLGGLLREQNRSIVAKVPIAGDVPGLGAAFRAVSTQKEQQEVVILITAHVVDPRRAGAEKLASRLEQGYVTPLDAIAAPNLGEQEMKSGSLAALLLAAIGLCGGCQEHIRPSDMTLSRGAGLLASGSPKSAIPFLEQTVAATPDGPEPLALLALAYALDLQPERAMAQAALVHREHTAAPGWEAVAVGIAEMTRHRSAPAIASFQRVTAGPASPIVPAAGQWLALAQILAGKHDEAVATLEILAKEPGMQTTALLWIALIQSYKGQPTCTATLGACAKAIASRSGQMALGGNLNAADDQTLYDAGVAALAGGDLPTARRLLELVQKHDALSSDAGIWLALITGAQGDHQAARTQLKEGCEKGSSSARGLANQLFSVVCALEERPEGVVEHTLAGQRMLNRSAASRQPMEQPAPENVWGSDHIK